MIRLIIIIIALSVVSFVSSCISATAGIAASNIPIPENRTYDIVGTEEVELHWNAFDIGLVGFALDNPPLDKAMATILENKKADALINIRYWMDRSIYLCVTRYRLGIKAEAIRFHAKAPSTND